MANIASQVKRNRQNLVRNQRNRAARSELKTRIRNVLEAAQSGDRTATAEQLRIAQKSIDKAATAGLIHKNTAARRKSRLSKQVADILG